MTTSGINSNRPTEVKQANQQSGFHWMDYSFAHIMAEHLLCHASNGKENASVIYMNSWISPSQLCECVGIPHLFWASA